MGLKYLYGIVVAPVSINLGASPSPLGFKPVYTVTQDSLVGVVSDHLDGNFTGLSKEELFRCLMAHQAVIERVMPERTILPLKFGTLVESDEEVRCLLRQGQEKFSQTLANMEGKVEMEVMATWELKRVLAEISREQEVERLRQSMAWNTASERLEWQVQAGRQVKELLDKRRQGYREQVMAGLGEIALDVQPHALMSDEMVMNIAFLLPKGGERDLEERVRKANHDFSHQLAFRLIGPLPPYSFTTVEVLRPRVEKIEEARRLLGLGAQVSAAEVKRAYRRLAPQSHPDVIQSSAQAMELFISLRKATTLLLYYCQGLSSGRGGDEEQYRYSLAPEDVSQTWLISIKRSVAGEG